VQAVALKWSEKVESASAVRDALGIWGHLDIQIDFVPGITSVTDRIRYYTNLAWYWKNLADKVTAADFEKIFILKCLAHHDGNSRSPHLDNVFNKTRFNGEWQRRNDFDLNFRINGFGRSYYAEQLRVLRCAWRDFAGIVRRSPINDKLASCLDQLNPDDFLYMTYSKEVLKNNLTRFCICDSETNEKEIEIMSMLFFGFFSYENMQWDIDEQEFKDFLNGRIELDFEKAAAAQLGFDLESVSATRAMNLRRRNTLFMFLKVIKETSPPLNLRELRRTLWDATYFRQNRKTRKFIEFGRLERVREFWEFFQLNVYYVYAIEMILNAIQLIVRNHPGIEKDKIIGVIEQGYFYEPISKLLEGPAEKLTVSELFKKVWEKNENKRTTLSSPINEAMIYELLSGAEKPEWILALALMMLILLRKRFETTEEGIRNYTSQRKELEIFEDKLAITRILGNIIEAEGNKPLLEYLRLLADFVIERHLLESAIRLSWGTTNWIFTEEQGTLYPARIDLVEFDARDNRWDSILHLLRDMKFVEGNPIRLTDKGLRWLQLVE
jgi:hypothetical protein